MEIRNGTFHPHFFQRPLGDGLAMGFQMGETMKRRDFIKVTGLGTAGAATIAAPAIERSDLAFECRLTKRIFEILIF